MTTEQETLEGRLARVESDVEAIRSRNARVEADKAWEISLTRRTLVALITYSCAAILLWLVGNADFFLTALVPTAGYLLSTLTLPWVKRQWVGCKSHGAQSSFPTGD